ncbi:MAG: hypothetical protein KY445_01715 [Armatimonadetes bacterium]|nr:hypothetical protein [Armatimonadota bacterium]
MNHLLKSLRLCAFAVVLLAGAFSAQAKEVQNHGVVFEKWIRDTFFDGYEPKSYTQKWDIPASANKRFGGVAINPKAIKYRAPVDLGDALRQYQIDEPFIMIIGYWQQEGDKKRFVNVVAARIEPAQYRKLWGDVTLEDLRKLDAVIKETPDYREARKLAQAMKKSKPFSSSIITLNPKIDSKTQRRLQCSLSFGNVFKHLAPTADPAIQERPLLWGVPVLGAFDSPARSFKRPTDPQTP